MLRNTRLCEERKINEDRLEEGNRTYCCCCYAGALAACGGSGDGDKKASSGTEAVTLSVWAPQEDQAKDTNWLGKVEENFAKAHPEYNITWKNDVVSEGDASKQVSTDPSAAADVYMFASDQLGVLMDAKAIGQLGTDAEKQVKEQNGDLEVNSVTGTDGKLYGVPYTDNTWFMYYNKSKITEDEAKDFDTILSKAKVTFSCRILGTSTASMMA